MDGAAFGGVGGFSRMELAMTRSCPGGERERERARGVDDSGASCESWDGGLASVVAVPEMVRCEDPEDRRGEEDWDRCCGPSGEDRDCPRGRPPGGTGSVGWLDGGKELAGVRVGLRGEEVLGIKGVFEVVIGGEFGEVDPLGLDPDSDMATAWRRVCFYAQLSHERMEGAADVERGLVEKK